MVVALAFRRLVFCFLLCHWPAEWLKTNDFNTSTKFHRVSVRLALSHSSSSCLFIAPLFNTSAESWSLFFLLIPYTSYSLPVPPDMPTCCVWDTGSQSRRNDSVLQEVFVKSTYLSFLTISQGLICPQRLLPWDITHGLSPDVHTQCSPEYVSQKHRKSRSPLPFAGLYVSFYHFHWHEILLSTRIPFPVLCTARRGFSSPEDPKVFLRLHDYRFIFLPSRPFLHKTTSVMTEVHH